MKKLLYSTLSVFLLFVACSKEEQAPPPPPTPTYTLSFSAEAGGSVSSEGGTYTQGSKITVTATPDAQYLFKEWSDGSTTNPREITVTSNLTLKASFIKKTYPLAVTIEGEGTVQEEVIIQGSTSETKYNAGTTVKLTATPNEGWVFAGWSGDIESEELEIEVPIEKGTAVSALFKKLVILPILNLDRDSSPFPTNSYINWNNHRQVHSEPFYLNQDNIPDVITSSRPLGTQQDPDIVPSLVVYDYSGTNIFEYNVKEQFNPQMRDSLNNLNIDYGDFNSDNKMDYALSFMGEYVDPSKNEGLAFEGVNVYLMISNNSGGYDITEIIDDPDNIQFGITIMDVDFDGDLDVVNYMNKGDVYLNNGNELFEKATIEPLYKSEHLHRMDWDKDGIVDVVNIGPHNKMITVLSANGIIKIPLENTGWDFYYTVQGYSEEWSVERSTVLDADNDGDWDIVFGGFYDKDGLKYKEQKYFENLGGQFRYVPDFIEHNYELKQNENDFKYNHLLKVWKGDLDGDGDTDLYHPTFNEEGNYIPYWWENTPEGFKMNFDFIAPNWSQQ